VKPDDVVIPPGWDKLYERWHYAPAVRDGDHLRCSGVIGVGPDGTIAPDAQTQFRHAFQRATAILAAAGLDFGDVLEMTTYHVHLQEHWTTFMQVMMSDSHALNRTFSASVTALLPTTYQKLYAECASKPRTP